MIECVAMGSVNEDSTTVQNTKEALREKKRAEERDRVREKGTRGVTDNALRGMSASGTVNVDSTGDVVNVNALSPPASIDLSVVKSRFEAKTEAMTRLFTDSEYEVDVTIFFDDDFASDDRIVFSASVYQNVDHEVMSLRVTVHGDNTAVVVSSTEDAEFDVAPVFEAVGNTPTLDRVFYDFKKQAKDDFLRDVIDRRREAIRALYAPKSKREKKTAGGSGGGTGSGKESRSK